MFAFDPEITKVTAFWGGMFRGLVNVKVLVTVILRYELVELRSTQYFPPSVVAVVAGNVMALNPELVK